MSLDLTDSLPKLLIQNPTAKLCNLRYRSSEIVLAVIASPATALPVI
jgi:hypothetical protein